MAEWRVRFRGGGLRRTLLGQRGSVYARSAGQRLRAPPSALLLASTTGESTGKLVDWKLSRWTISILSALEERADVAGGADEEVLGERGHSRH